MSINCSECGSKLKKEDLYCAECGAKILREDKLKSKERIKAYKILISRFFNHKLILGALIGIIICVVIIILFFIGSFTNKIEEAKKLIAERKSKEAISLLSEIDSSSENYPEAQGLIKIEKSRILYIEGLGKFVSGDYEEALSCFEKVEDDGKTFPDLISDIKNTKFSIGLIKELPGIYEGGTQEYFAGGYITIIGKMNISKYLGYKIDINTADAYTGGFHNEEYSGVFEPQFTHFKSGLDGFILNSRTIGKPFGENVFYYKYGNDLVVQFNMKSTNGRGWTLKLLRKSKNNLSLDEGTKNDAAKKNSNEEDVENSENKFNNSEDEFYENPDVIPRRADNHLFKFKCDSDPPNGNNLNPELNLELFIDKDGNVIDANILNGGGICLIFDQESTIIPQLLKYLKFDPGVIDNKKVPCRIEYKLRVEIY